MVKKIFGTALVVMIAWAWYGLMVDLYWETVNLKCQPSPEIVICRIFGSPALGGTNVDIPKTQLSGVKPVYRAMEGRIVQGIVLTTIDDREIPLNRSPKGEILHQLVEHKAKISAFIANPQAQTLNIETTRRDVPVTVIFMSIGIVLGAYLYLKKLWFGAK